MSALINTPFDESRRWVTTPDNSYRYQLVKLDGENTSNLITVWKLDRDDSWLAEMMILVDETGSGPQTVGTAPKDPRSTVAQYMAAAGHIWAARTAGLWDKED